MNNTSIQIRKDSNGQSVAVSVDEKHEDIVLLTLFDNLMERYNATIILPTGHAHNQSEKITKINSYLMSLYTNKSKNKSATFFNRMRKVLDDFVRKTYIKFSQISADIDDKEYDFLLDAAKAEACDDLDGEKYQLDYAKQMGKYGTAVSKIVHKKVGKSILEVVPFDRFICDPVNGQGLPKAEAYQTTFQAIKEGGKYDKDKIEEIESYYLTQSDMDYIPSKTSVWLYEVHGTIPKSGFKSGSTGVTNGMYIVLQADEMNKFILYKSERENITYQIDVLEEITGRTMGLGPMEAMLPGQILYNRVGNSMVRELEQGRNFYQTSDRQMDGKSLEGIDHNTVISFEEGHPLQVVSSPVQGYGAKQSFLNNLGVMEREGNSTQGQSLGQGAKSNVATLVARAASEEADGVYNHSKQVIFQMQRNNWKRKGGILDIIMDYFESGKEVERLLTKSKRLWFRKYIARKEAEAEQLMQAEQDLLYVDSIEDLTNFIVKRDKDKKITIHYEDGDIDREYIRDKVYITYGAGDDIISNKIAVSERIIALVSANPQAYPSFNLDAILVDMVENLSLVDGEKFKVQEMQSGSTGITEAVPANLNPAMN